MSQSQSQSQQPQTPVLQQPYVVLAQPESDVSKAVKDVSIVAVVIVIVIILIVVVSVALLIRFLRGVVDDAGKIAPTFECAAWLTLRQQGYLNGSPPPTNPATGKPYTICEATKQAINDSQVPANASVCPVKTTPPGADQQPPYIFYMGAQGCSNA
jgi:hypothetical protein